MPKKVSRFNGPKEQTSNIAAALDGNAVGAILEWVDVIVPVQVKT
jgi:hypothetical protein